MRIAMKRIIPWTLMLLFAGTLPMQAQYQTEALQQGPRNGPHSNPLRIYTWVHPLPQSDSIGVNVFLQVGNDFLHFMQKDSLFAAQYESSVSILRGKGESVAGEIRKHHVQADNYKEGQSRQRLHRDRFTFTVAPGEYSLYVEIHDKATLRPYRETLPLRVPAWHELALTTPLFFAAAPDSGSESTDFPSLPAVQSQEGPALEARLLLATQSPEIPIRISSAMISSQNDTLDQRSQELHLRSSMQWIRLPIPRKLTFGQYRLIVQAVQGEVRTHAEAPVTIQWAEHSEFMPDLKQAIEVLTYIMDKSEREALAQMDEKAQHAALEKFWKERDPTPETSRNELEEEYYRRVGYASRNLRSWKNRKPGWKTDRGRIYILYGEPSLIEKPLTPGTGNTQYEIWHYQHLNKKFLFMDKYNTGDFLLYAEE